MKIVDCFTFYNELDLLQYRLAALYDYVDFFILVEANITHAGHPKPTYFIDNMHLFEKYRDKIIHMVAELPHKSPNIDYSKKQQLNLKTAINNHNREIDNSKTHLNLPIVLDNEKYREKVQQQLNKNITRSENNNKVYNYSKNVISYVYD